MRIAPLEARHREPWERLVSERGGFMQSWAWSEFKTLEGYDVLRLGVFEGATLSGGSVAYLYPTPAEAHLAAIPDGPVLDWEAPWAADAFGALVAAIEAWARPGRLVALRVEPRLEVVPEALRSLPRAPVDLVPDETLEIDLGPEDAMLVRMKPKGRYNARLAARRGVEVVSSSDPGDVHELYFVLAETAHLQDFVLEPKSFFINLVHALFPSHGRLAFARFKGITLAAALTVRHGGTVTYLYGGHVPLFRRLMASYALHWHVMREAAREGCRVYDLYGWVGPERLDHAYHRFSRFKDKLGGRPVRRIGSRDVIFYDRLAEAALEALGAVEAP